MKKGDKVGVRVMREIFKFVGKMIVNYARIYLNQGGRLILSGILFDFFDQLLSGNKEKLMKSL